LFERNNDIGTVLSLPTYDYKCEECGSEFELRLRFSDSVDQPCNSCDKVATRQFSAVPIVFKGSGWYVNDYGKKGSSSGKNTNSSETEGTTTESSTETKSSSSTETKSGNDTKATSSDSSASSGSKTTSQPE
tara:strand:- start:152 stop:547 length:396 start_codon:yes stop_codon:yes gene_type:complete